MDFLDTMGTVASNNRYLFIAICLLLGNFVIFHDRERLVLAEVVGDASVLEHEGNSDTSFKGKSCRTLSESC